MCECGALAEWLTGRSQLTTQPSLALECTHWVSQAWYGAGRRSERLREILALDILLFKSMGWDCVSELQSPTGPLFIPQVVCEYGEPWWNYIDRGKLKNSEKRCHSATLSTTSPSWIDPLANPGLRCERPATNGLSHGTAFRIPFHYICDVVQVHWYVATTV
jgi:hypothetical protein